jgi:hypothetical protein
VGRRVAIRILVESLRISLAVLVGYGCALALESRCPPPTPENSSPGCEGLSYVYGAIIGFVGTILVSFVAQWLWERRRRLSPPS